MTPPKAVLILFSGMTSECNFQKESAISKALVLFIAKYWWQMEVEGSRHILNFVYEI